DTDDGVCYQVGPAAQSFQEAQKACENLGASVASVHNQQENTFIRKIAASHGAVNGVFLGAKGQDNQFSWIDGSAWDYKNFYPGFPISGRGDCLAMDTLSNSGEWMNMDCSSKIPVACARQGKFAFAAYKSFVSRTIQIYSPGYPYDASIPCDYVLQVDEGKKVHVEVQILEANTCCDHLLLEDKMLGGNFDRRDLGQDLHYRLIQFHESLVAAEWRSEC
ncbi:hypothetical protein PMAYCL1PPCAC_22221, partial [Pristionchus mayeri]